MSYKLEKEDDCAEEGGDNSENSRITHANLSILVFTYLHYDNHGSDYPE